LAATGGKMDEHFDWSPPPSSALSPTHENDDDDDVIDASIEGYTPWKKQRMPHGFVFE